MASLRFETFRTQDGLALEVPRDDARLLLAPGYPLKPDFFLQGAEQSITWSSTWAPNRGWCAIQ